MKIKRILNFGSALIVSLSSLLVINMGAALAVANDCTWTGTNSLNFNDAGNWTSCNSTVPQTGDNLVFDNSSLVQSVTLNNDMTGLSVNNITFSGSTAYVFSVNGNAMTVAGAIAATGINSAILGTDLTLSGSGTAVSGNMTLGKLTGSVGLTYTGGASGTLWLVGDNSGLTGNIDIVSGNVWAQTPTALGDTVASTTVEDGAYLNLDEDNIGTTLAEPLTIAGDGNGQMWTNGAINAYSASQTKSFTLSGSITLTADTSIIPGVYTGNKLILTGSINGAFKMSVAEGAAGKLVVQSSSNNSSTENGTYDAPKTSYTLSDTQDSTPLTVNYNQTYILDGTRSNVNVSDGGTLKGTGSNLGTLVVDAGGILAPGHSPGCLSSGSMTLNGTYQVELGGTTACSGYDQMNITGTVDVTGATLDTSLYGKFKPKAGDSFMIIKNDGTDAVTGTFKNLKEGATFKLSGYVFQISYKGGTGNDVVLTVKSVPTTPDTGFAFTGSNPTTVLLGTLAASGILLGLGRKLKLAYAKR